MGSNNDGWGSTNTKFETTDEWNAGTKTITPDWDNEAGAGSDDFGGEASGGAFDQSGESAPAFNGNSGGCFNCGEDGHMKAECPNPLKPREFTGTCNDCGEVGHRAQTCPNKPKICKQCHAENDHDTIDCKNKKVIDRSRVEEKSVKEAWAMLREASDEFEIGDFRDAVQVLAKALDGGLTYLHLEKECRKRDLKIHLIALKKDVAQTYTNVDLEGNVGKTYTLGYFASAACPRPILMPLWPKDTAENLERLEDVGVPTERGIPLCGNCDTLGHLRKDCPEEKNVHEGPKVTCALCDEPGHRVRDCTQERQKPRAPRACKVCGSEEHLAKDCEDKPALVCRNCFEEGHHKSDCTNEKVFKCDNCEELGHKARECKAPKDWTKHKCRHCGEFGHGSENRCDPEKKAAFAAAKAAEEGGDGLDNGDNNGCETAGDGAASNDAWASNSAPLGQSTWESAPVAAAATTGGW